MRKIKNKHTTLISLILILGFFGIKMMFVDPGALSQLGQEQSELREVKEGIHQQVEASINWDTSNYIEAQVLDIVDGDTIWVQIEQKRKKVRFIGINTPEIGEFNYEEASQFKRRILSGKKIYLEKDISETDKYDRLLRYIWLDIPNADTDAEKNEKLFNGMLLNEGFAEIATYKPDTKYLDYYQRLVN